MCEFVYVILSPHIDLLRYLRMVIPSYLEVSWSRPQSREVAKLGCGPTSLSPCQHSAVQTQVFGVYT